MASKDKPMLFLLGDGKGNLPTVEDIATLVEKLTGKKPARGDGGVQGDIGNHCGMRLRETTR